MIAHICIESVQLGEIEETDRIRFKNERRSYDLRGWREDVEAYLRLRRDDGSKAERKP